MDFAQRHREAGTEQVTDEQSSLLHDPTSLFLLTRTGVPRTASFHAALSGPAPTPQPCGMNTW